MSSSWGPSEARSAARQPPSSWGRSRVGTTTLSGGRSVTGCFVAWRAHHCSIRLLATSRDSKMNDEFSGALRREAPTTVAEVLAMIQEKSEAVVATGDSSTIKALYVELGSLLESAVGDD